jgi:hypothetical protein
VSSSTTLGTLSFANTAYRSIGPRIRRRIPSESKVRVNAQLIADPADYFIWAFTLSGWLTSEVWSG